MEVCGTQVEGRGGGGEAKTEGGEGGEWWWCLLHHFWTTSSDVSLSTIVPPRGTCPPHHHWPDPSLSCVRFATCPAVFAAPPPAALQSFSQSPDFSQLKHFMGPFFEFFQRGSNSEKPCSCLATHEYTASL